MPIPGRTINLPWPAGGVNENFGYTHQPGSPSQGNQPGLPTCVNAQNVVNYEPGTGRSRGGSRAGFSKWAATQINSTNAVQLMRQVAISAAFSGTVVRTLYVLGVAGGTVKKIATSGHTLATNGTTALSTTAPYIAGAPLFGKVYFADGASTKYWDAATNTVSTWTPSGGSLPGSGGTRCRLGCVWRTRIVLSGLFVDGHNWFMSRLGDPLDWDYGTWGDDVNQPVAGNSSPADYCPDVITTLIPFDDDNLIFGCDHSIYRMTNDPGDQGFIDHISSVTGMAFGQSWCVDPQGRIYFIGSRGGLYRMNSVNDKPERLSADKIESRLGAIDLSTSVVRLEWDDKSQSVFIFVTPASGNATGWYIYEARTGAFWPQLFATHDHNPLCTLTVDGDDPDDRFLLVGSRDGYVRKLDYSADDDDGSAISSFVFLGPVQGSGMNAIELQELDITLGSNSDDITYSLHRGSNAEEAFGASAWWSGTWTSTRQAKERRRARAHAAFLKLLNSTVDRSWSFEWAAARVTDLSLPASRGV